MNTVIKLIIASLVVGLLLKFIGTTPLEFWKDLGDVLVGIWKWITGFLGENVTTLLAGAAIVVPVYLVRELIRKSKRGRAVGGSGQRKDG